MKHTRLLDFHRKNYSEINPTISMKKGKGKVLSFVAFFALPQRMEEADTNRFVMNKVSL